MHVIWYNNKNDHTFVHFIVTIEYMLLLLLRGITIFCFPFYSAWFIHLMVFLLFVESRSPAQRVILPSQWRNRLAIFFQTMREKTFYDAHEYQLVLFEPDKIFRAVWVITRMEMICQNVNSLLPKCHRTILLCFTFCYGRCKCVNQWLHVFFSSHYSVLWVFAPLFAQVN